MVQSVEAGSKQSVMPAKLQFQFAGVDLSRPSSPHRKWLRIGLISFGVLVASLAYYQYLHFLAHGPKGPVTAVSKAVTAASSASAKTSAASVAVASVTATRSLKEVAEDGVKALGSSLLQAAKNAAPASAATVPVVSPTMTAPVSAAPTAATTATAPGVQITLKAPARRAPRAHTEPELLQMAGLTAFDNVMALADKYPDAYGFAAGDFLSDAKLGEPILVYSIDEASRANYKTGQPVKPLLKPCNRWVFPVTLNGRLCCMVQVRQTGKNFVPGSGSKALAMAWTKILENWPAEQGYHPQLVVNPQIPGYYFTVPELPMPNMTDTVMMTYFNPCTSPADVILASWR